MRKLLLILSVLLVCLQLSAQFTKATLQATGLTCAMCSNAINRSLLKVPFVESVKSDIANSAFNIVFKPNAAVDIDALKKAVEDAGFSVGALKITGKFNEMKIENEKHIQIGDQQFCFLNVEQKTLNGEETLKVIDKNFITSREFKKISSSTKMSCLQTGHAAACCGMPADNNTRIYHVTI